MGRAGFTGSDYSSLLGGLYESEQKRIAAEKAADARASIGVYSNDARFHGAQEPQGYGGSSATSSADKSAEDQDMADMWSNGLISDDEWLSYIAGRVADTAGDPKQNIKWVKYQRKYATQINDGRADFAYRQGGAAKDYLSYNQTVLDGMNPDSQEYRDRLTLVNQLKDQVATQDIATRATQIATDIKNKKATLYDLRKYYASAIKTLKPGEYRNSVQASLDEVSNAIQKNETSGQITQYEYRYGRGEISGAAVAKKIRQIADKYYSTDTDAYYTLLERADKYSSAPGLAGSGGSGGGGGGGSGGAVVKKPKTPLQEIDTQINESDSRREFLEGLLKIALADPKATQIEDPSRPNVFYDRDQLIHAATQDVVDEYDTRSALQLSKVPLQKTGEGAEASSKTLTDKGLFITKVAQPLNTLTARGRIVELMNTAQADLEATAANGYSTDVGATGRRAKEWGDLIQTAIQNEYSYQNSYVNILGGASERSALTPELMPSANAFDDELAYAQSLSDPNLQITDGGVEQIAQMPGQSSSVLQKTPAKTLLNTIATSRRQEALVNAGLATLVATPDGYAVVEYEQKTRNFGEAYLTGNLDPASVAALGLNEDETLVPYQYKIGGEVRVGYAIGTPDKVGHKAWQAKQDIYGPDGKVLIESGKFIPDSFIASDTTWGDRQAAGEVGLTEVGDGLLKMTLPAVIDGATRLPERTYYYDVASGRTSYGGTNNNPEYRPMSYADVNRDGVADVDENGNLSIALDTYAPWEPMARMGVSPQESVAFLKTMGGSDVMGLYAPDGSLINAPVYALDANGKVLRNNSATDANGNPQAVGPVRDKWLLGNFEANMNDSPDKEKSMTIAEERYIKAGRMDPDKNPYLMYEPTRFPGAATTASGGFGYAAPTPGRVTGMAGRLTTDSGNAPGTAVGDVSSAIANAVKTVADQLGIKIASEAAAAKAAQSNRNLSRVMSGGAAPVAIPTMPVIVSKTPTYSGPSGKVDRAPSLPKIKAPAPPKVTKTAVAAVGSSAIAKGIKPAAQKTTKKPAAKEPTAKKVVNKAVAS